MKQIILTFALVLTGLALFAQSPRIRLNQITKDSITGSIVLSGLDSNMVYSRNFYIGTDSSLVFYGTTIVGGGGAGGSFVTLPQLNDSLNNYVDFGSLSDSLVNYINSITLSDSLINYISKTAAFGGDVTGTYDNIIVTDNSHNHTITTLTGIQDSLNTKAALVHTHTITDIVGLQDSLNSKAALIHSHAISDVASLQDSLNAKAPTVHTHTISDVASLQDSLNDKANDADLNNYLLTSNYIVDSTRINATGDTAYYYQNGVLIGTGAIAGGGGGGGGGTVTSVSAGTQISGMSMTITNPTTTPSIATAITSQSDFRTAIGAGTGNGTVTGVTAGTFLSGGTITSSGTIALDTASAGLKTYISQNGGGGTVNLASQVTGTLPVANGGTGVSSLTANKVLVGNGTDTVLTPTNLHWDNANSRLGIKKFPSSSELEVFGSYRTVINSGQGYDNLIGSISGVSNGYIQSADTLNQITYSFYSGTNNILIRINNNGNVGIGTTSPAYTLDVVGDINASGEVRNSGVILTSDARYKKDINSIQNATYKLTELNPVSYYWNELMLDNLKNSQSKTKDKIKYGLVAQEVELYFPEFVSEGADGFKAIDYQAIISLLIKGWQEQQAIINQQQTEIDNLKTQIQNILTEINNLKNN